MAAGKPVASPLALAQIATPSANPPSGSTLLYVKSDGKVYTKSPAGTEVVVGAPGAHTHLISDVTGLQGALDTKLDASANVYDDAAANSEGTASSYSPSSVPHTASNGLWTTSPLTKADVGLSNADNTSDAAKPVSTAQQTALNAKQNVIVARVALFGNPALSGTYTVNGVALVAGDVVLARDQASTATNGVYVVAAGAWTRHPMADTSAKIDGLQVFTRQGTFWKGVTWVTRWSSVTDTLGTTGMAWSIPLIDSDAGSTVASLSSGAVPASQLGNAALSTQGGAEKVAAASGTSGTVTLNAATASVFTLTPAGTCTIAISGQPVSGLACTLTLIVSQGASPSTINAPTGTVWMSPQPTQVGNKRTIYTLMTTDGGTSWLVSAVVQP